MCPDMRHAWTCDAKRFEEDDALAGYMAERIDAGEEGVLFAREGCMFRLTYEDRPIPATVNPPKDAIWRSRTYSVTLVTNSPTCIGGNVFTTTWPNDYTHEPVQVVATDGSPDTPVIVDGTMHDVRRMLTEIGVVLWPESYDL